MMSPSSEMEILGEALNQEHVIHEYAFGIISSDRKGMPTVVGISQPYKKRVKSDSESSEDGQTDNSSVEGFQNWSMSMYQRGDLRGEEESDMVSSQQDNNNNLTPIVGSAPSGAGGFLRDYPAKAFVNAGSGEGIAKVASKKPSLTRTWSSSTVFKTGNKTPVLRPRVLSRTSSLDPEEPEIILAAEPPKRWHAPITQIPDKIRQHIADKNRFNLKTVPREQLRRLQCY